MSLFKQLLGDSKEINCRYAQIRDANIKKGFQQAKEKGIDIPTEPFEIVKRVPLPGQVDGEHYWSVADYILAEYSTELALQVATAFCNMAPQLGFDPFCKIMVGVQYVDKKVGIPNISKMSFGKQHPEFYTFITEKDCPERTKKALDFLTTAIFQFSSATQAREIFPKLLVVPEMETEVKQKLYSIDKAIAKYIIK